MELKKCKLVVIFILFYVIPYLSASVGDRSPFYQNCVKNCAKTNCTDGGKSYKPNGAMEHEANSQLFVWNCLDECRYICMWRTVGVFQERGYQIPKFHGKWPFKRIMGMQEPAAAFASFLNLAAHGYMLTELIREVPADRIPVVRLWHCFAAVCMNTWVCSMVFHAYDCPTTEFLDYASALAMVIGYFAAAVLRALHRRRKLTVALVVAAGLFYARHVRYLRAGDVDYGYNMTVNVSFGASASLLWAVWAWSQWAGGRRYAWRAAAFVALSAAALALELLDFPPYRRAWDAHALWHLATAPLPLLFYRYVIDDLRYTHGPHDGGLKSETKTT